MMYLKLLQFDGKKFTILIILLKWNCNSISILSLHCATWASDQYPFFTDLHEICRVPLNLAEENSINSGENTVSLCQSKVCGDNITIRDCGEDVAHWLAKILDRDNIRLVRHIQRHSKNNSGKNSIL